MLQNDKKVISIYDNSLGRVGENYAVSLPFKSELVAMPNDFKSAEKRISSLSRFLTKPPELLASYVKFMPTQSF